MASVAVHTETGGRWLVQPWEFQRVPCVGEYVTLAPGNHYYRVQHVAHTPWNTPGYDAHIWMTPAEPPGVMRLP